MHMDQIYGLLESQVELPGIASLETMLLALLFSFVLSQVFAWVYYYTHSGLSYARSFVHSLILISIVVTLIMQVIGNSLVTAFGLMGALAIIRIRNTLKDTRDIAFIFSVLVVGMACGTHHFALAILGTVFLCMVIMYLHISSFGTHQPHNGFLRFTLDGTVGPEHNLPTLLKEFCTSFTLISVQDNGPTGQSEYAYQLMVRNKDKNESFVHQLENILNVSRINLVMQEEMLEV